MVSLWVKAWVVDEVSCRGHHQVREGGCEGFEAGQWQDSGPGGGGDRVAHSPYEKPGYCARPDGLVDELGARAGDVTAMR